jgi:hypothetical protein
VVSQPNFEIINRLKLHDSIRQVRHHDHGGADLYQADSIPSRISVNANSTPAKIKTRRRSHNGTPDSVPYDLPPNNDQLGIEETCRISLLERAYKVFSTISHHLSKEDQHSEVPWTDFLHTMGTMGFSPEKFYGSVSQFTPSDQATNVSRNIQFHEPHPD